jgi:4-hydroxy-2-oxoglutarate aldolase
MYLSGIFPALTTPFYSDGRVYFRKIEHNADRYSRTPVAGLVVLGSTGEAIMLSDEERRDVLRVTREFTAPEKVLIAGVGAESVRETLAMCDFAAQQGFDVALVRTPHFYRPQMTPENILNFYRTVADHSPLPVLLYSVPVYTAYDLPVEVVAQLSEHPNIIGMKDSGGKMEKIKQIIAQTRGAKQAFEVTEVFSAVTGRMKREQEKEDAPLVQIEGAPPVAVVPNPKLKTRTREVGFQLLSGTATQILEALQAGCSGSVLGAAAFVPTACFEVVAAFKDNDIALATEKQQRLMEPSKRIVSELGVPGIKYACDWNGYYGGPPRLPLLPLTMEQKKTVESVLADLRN